MKRFLVTFILALVVCCSFTSVNVVSAKEKPNSSSSSQESNSINDFNVSMNSDGTLSTTIENGDAVSTWGKIFQKAKVFLIGFTGLGTLVFGFFFVKGLIGLAATANKPVQRQEAINGLLWTGIATAGCGGVTIIIGLFWNALK